MMLSLKTEACQHAWSHSQLVTADYRQSTKFVAAAHISSYIGFFKMPMVTMIATGCECRRREPHAGGSQL